MVILDESGFLWQPSRRRTWAPRGQTPLHRCWARHERLSVLGALTHSPQRRRLGFAFRLHPHNIRSPDLGAFLVALHRQLRRPLVVVLDRWSVHRTAIAALRTRRPPWLVGISWLPPYAPELNPVEQIWNHTKYSELANFLPNTVAELQDEVGLALASKRYQPLLLQACFRCAKLKL